VYSQNYAVAAKNYADVPTESYSNPQLKEFSESPDYLLRRGKPDEYFASFSVADINMELDKNRTPSAI
jgi:hypothetical protein